MFGFALGGRLYVGGGSGKDVWSYNPDTIQWTRKADLPDFQGGASGFAVGGKGYCVGGINNGVDLKKVLEYDPTGNTWTAKGNFSGTAREAAVAVVVGSYAYFGTGLASGTPLNDWWRYDPSTDSWLARAALPGAARAAASAFSASGIAHVAFGFKVDSGIVRLHDVWGYDPASNSWDQKADYGYAGARDGAIAFSFPSAGYAGGGWNGVDDFDDFASYRPDTDAWTGVEDPPRGGIIGPVSLTLGSGYIVGGQYFNVLGQLVYSNEVYEFTAPAAERTIRVRWSVKTLAAKTPRIRWSVGRDPVSQTSKVRWGIRTIAAHDAVILWHIGGPVSHTAKVRWWIGDVAAHTAKVRWKLFNPPVEKTVMIRWGTRTVAQMVSRIRWRKGPTCSEPITFKVWGQSGAIARSADAKFRDCVD